MARLGCSRCVHIACEANTAEVWRLTAACSSFRASSIDGWDWSQPFRLSEPIRQTPNQTLGPTWGYKQRPARADARAARARAASGWVRRPAAACGGGAPPPERGACTRPRAAGGEIDGRRPRLGPACVWNVDGPRLAACRTSQGLDLGLKALRAARGPNATRPSDAESLNIAPGAASGPARQGQVLARAFVGLSRGRRHRLKLARRVSAPNTWHDRPLRTTGEGTLKWGSGPAGRAANGSCQR